jgi:hypothetical protein
VPGIEAEPATVTKDTLLRGDHYVVSIKAGTVVEVVDHDGKTATISYRGQKGQLSEAVLALGSKPAPAAPAPSPSPQPQRKSVLATDAPRAPTGTSSRRPRPTPPSTTPT